MHTLGVILLGGILLGAFPIQQEGPPACVQVSVSERAFSRTDTMTIRWKSESVERQLSLRLDAMNLLCPDIIISDDPAEVIERGIKVNEWVDAQVRRSGNFLWFTAQVHIAYTGAAGRYMDVLLFMAPDIYYVNTNTGKVDSYHLFGDLKEWLRDHTTTDAIVSELIDKIVLEAAKWQELIQKS